MKNTSDGPKKRRGLWWKIPLGLLLVLFVGLVVVILNIDSIAHTQINKALNHYLAAGGKLETIDIQLMAGRVGLAGLTINSPLGSGPHPLLALNEVEVDIAPLSILSGKIVVESVAMNGLSLVIVRDKQGRLSPMELIPAASPTSEPESAADKGEAGLPWIPTVYVNSMQVEELSLRLIDQLTAEQWSAALHLDLTLAGLRLEDLMERDILVDRINLAASEIAVDQPPGFGQDPLLAIAKFELESQDVDLNTSKVPISKVMLDNLTASLERNRDGEINLIKLMDAWVPVFAGEKAKNETTVVQSSDGEEPAPSFELPTLIFDDIQLKSVTAQVLDTIDGRPWRAGFDGLDILFTGVEVGDPAKQAVALASFDLDIKGIAVDQLPGFSQAPLLAVDKFELASQDIDLRTAKVSFSKVVLDTLTASLERNRDGEINLLEVMDAWVPVVAGDKGKSETTIAQSPAGEEPAPAFGLPTLIFDDIQLKSVTAQLLDAIDGQPWRAGFDGLDILITGMKVGDPAKQAIALASFDLDIKGIAVDQPPGFSQNPLLAIDKFELASKGIDLSKAKVSVSKIMLDKMIASLERNPDREVNLLKVMDAWMPFIAGDKAKKKTIVTQSSAGKEPEPAFKLPTLFVDDLQLKSVTAQALDAIDGQPWRAGFDGLDILITGMEVGDLAKQAIALASFDLDLKGIAADQPPGFGTRKLISLDRFTVNSEKLDMSSKELVVRKVLLQGLSSSMSMRSDGSTNLQKLSDALLGSADKTRPRQDKEETTADSETPTARVALPAVRFEQILLAGGSVVYRDEAFAEEPLVAVLNNIRMEATQLRLFAEDDGVGPASASASFELEQPGDLPTAYFGTLAKVGPVGRGIPMVNTQGRMIGLKLDTLGSLVPPATRTALGASGLDGGVALAMDADSISLIASVLTDRNIQYEGITVQGSLESPIVEIGPVLAGIYSRVADGLINIGQSGLIAGFNIAEGGVDAAMELGSGAAKVGKNLGKGLFGTIAGLLTLDEQKVKKGVSGTTMGTIDLTIDSVEGTGKVAGGGLKSSASELIGDNRVRAWEKEIPTRYRKAMQNARDALSKMPYPPFTQ